MIYFKLQLQLIFRNNKYFSAIIVNFQTYYGKIFIILINSYHRAYEAVDEVWYVPTDVVITELDSLYKVCCFAECLSFHFTPFNSTQAEYASTYHEGSESYLNQLQLGI